MKVICTNPGRCPMCVGDAPSHLVRGRAYTVIDEARFGDYHGYQLAEVPPPPNWWHCSPHFTPLEAADKNIFELADLPVILEDA